MKAITLFLFTFALGWRSQAEVLLRPALGYTIDKTEQTPPPTTTTRTLIDVALGYVTSDGWTLLGMYGSDSSSTESGGSSSKANRTSYGAGGGYISKAGPYIDGVYFVSSDWKVGDNTYKGSGYQLDLGWKFDVGRTGIGLQMSYKSFTYTKVGGLPLEPPLKKTNLDPMFAVLFMF